jgi:hypothetical protein
VIYAQSIAAFHNGFKADSDGNSKHAAPLGAIQNNRAWLALTRVTAMPSTTPEGLCSKARVVGILLQANEDQSFEAAEVAFLKSFAVEVGDFLQPICDGKN